MSTGTIQSASKTVIKQDNRSAIRQTFTANGVLKQGQLVKFSGNGIVTKCSVATDYGIGIVEVGGADTEKVTVLITGYIADCLVINKHSGTIAAGSFVNYNGTVTAAGVPEVIVAASTKQAQAIVLSGGVANAEVRVGILSGPYKVA